MRLFNTMPSILSLAGLAGMLLLVTSSSTQRRIDSPKTADQKLAEITVPNGYMVEVAAGPDLVDYPIFATVDETVRMFVYESVNAFQDGSPRI